MSLCETSGCGWHDIKMLKMVVDGMRYEPLIFVVQLELQQISYAKSGNDKIKLLTSIEI